MTAPTDHHPLEGHTVKRYDGELSHLHVLIVEMAGLVTAQLNRALQVLAHKDIEAALQVIDADDAVDSLELKADAEIQTILARRTPVAGDLRIVLACSKAVTDMEKVGDEASKLARIAMQIYQGETPPPSKKLVRDIGRIGAVAINLFQRASAVLDELDATAAEQVIRDSRELEEEFDDTLRLMATYIMEDSRNVGHAVRVVTAVKALERVGDHAQSIAEQVVFSISGEDVRHRRMTAQREEP